MSLAVLDAVPGARIYAFEPGRHQRELFAETIRRNGLAERISLSPLALSDSAGVARFAVHVTRDSGMDGLIDTGRARRARYETVQVDTLDAWWARSGSPRIDVVKLDTEGSELLVLRGAGEMLTRCRPVILIEIHPANVAPYPYEAADVFAHLEARGYQVDEVAYTEYVARPR
jgi:FkbM family methyltransferase